LVECAVLGAVHVVLERSCCVHVMPMLSKVLSGGAVGRAVQVQKVLQVVLVAVPYRCCRVLLLFRPWGELLSMLSSAAECCCCPGCPAGAVQAWGKCCPCCPVAWFLVWRRKGAAAHVYELLGVEMVLLSSSLEKGRIPLLVRFSSSFWTPLHVFLHGQVKERFVHWICRNGSEWMLLSTCCPWKELCNNWDSFLSIT